MDKLDAMIAEALSEEDRALVGEIGGPGFFGEWFATYRGRDAWVMWLTTLSMVVYVGLALWAAWGFFTATEVIEVLRWGVIGSVSIMVIGMMKLYLFSQMQTQRLIREIKRVELMLAARES